MKQRVSISRFGLEFEEFLFASLGDDRNGTPLAIASLLGRMNLDPWHEAASLAALPPDVAAEKLASFIDAMPDQPLKHLESATLAARLIALLPGQPRSKDPERGPIASAGVGTGAGAGVGSGAGAGAGAKIGRGPLKYVIWFAIVCMLLAVAFANASYIPSAQSVITR